MLASKAWKLARQAGDPSNWISWLVAFVKASILAYALAWGPVFGAVLVGAVIIGLEYPILIAAIAAKCCSWAFFPLCPYLARKLAMWRCK